MQMIMKNVKIDYINTKNPFYNRLYKMDFKLRNYQKTAIQKVNDYLKKEDKGLVKMFCGSGKSIIMVKVMEKQRKNLSVYVFPSLSLHQPEFKIRQDKS